VTEVTGTPTPRLAFISYRRDDSRDWAHLIADAIHRAFGRESLFLDTDGIRVGDAWTQRIDRALDASHVLVPVIGSKWLFLQNPEDGRRRLDVENDWVRRELEHAITRGKPILPVLVSGMRMPAAAALPPSIQQLCSRQALQVTDRSDLPAIIAGLEHHGFVKSSTHTELDFPTPVDRSPRMAETDLHDALQRLPGWRVESRDSGRGLDHKAEELVTTLKFKSFEDAVHFIATASRYVSALDHHPFWENQYKDVRIRLTTWDIGMRITSKDVRLAEYLQWLHREYEPGERPDRMPPTR
jgi:pterin-4a-carbinolamine dehydratase